MTTPKGKRETIERRAQAFHAWTEAAAARASSVHLSAPKRPSEPEAATLRGNPVPRQVVVSSPVVSLLARGAHAGDISDSGGPEHLPPLPERLVEENHPRFDARDRGGGLVDRPQLPDRHAPRLCSLEVGEGAAAPR